MPRHVWSTLCSKSIIDKESNNISLLEILEEVLLEVPGEEKGSVMPIGLVAFSFEWVTLWARAQFGRPSSGHARDVVLAPSGMVIFEREYELDLSVHERSRIRRGFGTLPFRESGQYQFCTQVKDEESGVWQDVSSIPLTVKLKTSEATQT